MAPFDWGNYLLNWMGLIIAYKWIDHQSLMFIKIYSAFMKQFDPTNCRIDLILSYQQQPSSVLILHEDLFNLHVIIRLNQLSKKLLTRCFPISQIDLQLLIPSTFQIHFLEVDKHVIGTTVHEIESTLPLYQAKFIINYSIFPTVLATIWIPVFIPVFIHYTKWLAVN